VIDSASNPTNGAGCKPSSGLLSGADSAARRPFTRLVLHAPLVPAPLTGAPLRVVRSGRYALTRAADGSWSLSYRRCTGGTCAVAQPVAGPFAAPADSGLVFASLRGSPQLSVFLRAAPIDANAPRESAMLHFTLRNRALALP